MIILKKGQNVRVRVTGSEQWFLAKVLLASENGKSVLLILTDDEMMPMRQGLTSFGVPLIIDYDAGTIMGLDGEQYDIEVSASA